VKKRNLAKETNSEPWTAANKRYISNPWWDYTNKETDISMELDADFNMPKIHLMSHWAEQVHRHRALQQYSAERYEQAHNTNFKDSWKASNHNVNYLPLVVTFQLRILCLKIQELNVQALAQCWENSAAACNVLPSSADLASTLSPQS
jgi:hypothetical protein